MFSSSQYQGLPWRAPDWVCTLSQCDYKDSAHPRAGRRVPLAQMSGINDHRRAPWHSEGSRHACRPLTSSIAVTKVWEPPHVPQSHAVSNTGEQELVLPPPLLPRDDRGRSDCRTWRLGFKLWSRCRSGAVAILSDALPFQMYWILEEKSKIY